MRPRHHKYNPKRRLLPAGEVAARPGALAALSRQVQYGGNPEHKRNPGDFDLTPPAAPRPGKSLCDDAQVFRREVALQLLQQGLELGLVSDRFEGEWPCNVWMVNDGVAFEAEWERAGVYHGYPMPDNDPFREEVLRRWRTRHE